jgi:hypothetical protein
VRRRGGVEIANRRSAPTPLIPPRSARHPHTAGRAPLRERYSARAALVRLGLWRSRCSPSYRLSGLVTRLSVWRLVGKSGAKRQSMTDSTPFSPITQGEPMETSSFFAETSRQLLPCCWPRCKIGRQMRSLHEFRRKLFDNSASLPHLHFIGRRPRRTRACEKRHQSPERRVRRLRPSCARVVRRSPLSGLRHLSTADRFAAGKHRRAGGRSVCPRTPIGR